MTGAQTARGLAAPLLAVVSPSFFHGICDSGDEREVAFGAEKILPTQAAAENPSHY